MITVAGNTSLNKLNYYVWKDAIELKLINYLPFVNYLSIHPATRILIVSHLSITQLDISELKLFKSNGGKVVLFLFDSFDTLSKQNRNLIIQYASNFIIDYIYSFDIKDCVNYKFNYWPQICSFLPNITKKK